MVAGIVRKIELLAPAKNLSCGIAAVNHGADAVYIGGPPSTISGWLQRFPGSIPGTICHDTLKGARTLGLRTPPTDPGIPDASKDPLPHTHDGPVYEPALARVVWLLCCGQLRPRSHARVQRSAYDRGGFRCLAAIQVRDTRPGRRSFARSLVADCFPRGIESPKGAGFPARPSGRNVNSRRRKNPS